MAITDINISEELMTDAPSIKYRGEEGPKSPQQEQMMMVDSMLRDEYEQYVYDLLEQRPEATPMSFEEFRQMVIGEGMMGGGNPLPQDPTKPVNPFQPKPTGPVLPDRQMAAYGGIMGLDGRKQYGIGSWFQKAKDKVVDDLIPNEIKENPLLTAAIIAGGDQLLNEGKITDTVLDSILGEKITKQGNVERSGGLLETIKDLGKGAKDATVEFLGKQTNPNDPKSQTYGGAILSGISKNILPIVGGIGAGLFTKNTESDTPGLPSDNTALNLAEYKKAANLLDQKQGLAANMNFLPSVSARKYSPEEMAITYAQAANGGRIGFNMGGSPFSELEIFQLKNLGYDVAGKGVEPFGGVEVLKDILRVNQQRMAIGGRAGMAEGGIMDLGGMEKDYRAEGGFVPIGREEKADDVPARLSVNEFVFTADAVRNAGGGDIDQGAQVMENMMKHLEAGGQVSEESQGMAGARDMFEVSERLSEVI
jgi:uncharacterized short protein YbdD (DUF466 family)